jgi:hypothetical protein
MKERYHITDVVIIGDNIQADLKEVVYGVQTRLYHLNTVQWRIFVNEIMKVMVLLGVGNFLTI